MAFNLQQVTEKLLQHPYFEKAKKVREVSAGHTEDSVFTHLSQTAGVAIHSRDGDFITNPQAKECFTSFMNREVHGVLQKDIAVILAQVHDIGKIVSLREDEKVFSMNHQRPNAPAGNTYNPGHEYYGSLIVGDVFATTDIPQDVVEYISQLVLHHGRVFDYYANFRDFSLNDAIADMKSRVDGPHVEILFNSYCDVAYNKQMQPCRELIVEMLNQPHTYSQREYFVE